jgi:uncharacterized protein with von Willebrand factor type A (vWA) domain
MASGMPGSRVTKEAWTKACMLAILAIARLHKRDMAVIHFGTEIKTWIFPKGIAKPQDLIECADFFMSAGNEDYPLWMKAALKLVDESKFEKADVICLADGQSQISNEALKEWDKRRKEREMRCYSVLIGDWGYGHGFLEKISDSVQTISNLSEDKDVLTKMFSV